MRTIESIIFALPTFKEAFMPNLYANFIGIDVSKNILDVYGTKNNKHRVIENKRHKQFA